MNLAQRTGRSQTSKDLTMAWRKKAGGWVCWMWGSVGELDVGFGGMGWGGWSVGLLRLRTPDE